VVSVRVVPSRWVGCWVFVFVVLVVGFVLWVSCVLFCFVCGSLVWCWFPGGWLVFWCWLFGVGVFRVFFFWVVGFFVLVSVWLVFVSSGVGLFLCVSEFFPPFSHFLQFLPPYIIFVS
jgi:hypothetical protein